MSWQLAIAFFWVVPVALIILWVTKRMQTKARALLKDAPIVLLDEATASVDAENETKIQAGLSELVRGRTVLVIAHRMRTVANADKGSCWKTGVLLKPVLRRCSKSKTVFLHGCYTYRQVMALILQY